MSDGGQRGDLKHRSAAGYRVACRADLLHAGHPRTSGCLLRDGLWSQTALQVLGWSVGVARQTCKSQNAFGLYIATEIARAHGGTFDVISMAEKPRFTFKMLVE
ncbi:hypothetical protein [Rhodopseudomonas parapalustris]